MGSDQSTQQQQGAAGQPGGGNKRKSDSSQASEEPLFDRAKYYDGRNTVQLAYSSLGGIPGVQAYHTSVVVNGEEYFFDMGGVMTTRDLASHNRPQPGSMDGDGSGGFETVNSQQSALDNPNANKGTTGTPQGGNRLPKQFRSLEEWGKKYPSLVSQGGYQPNPKADNFDAEAVIAKNDPAAMWKSPGYTLGGGGAGGAAAANGSPGGGPALTPEEMRRKRLEALEKREREAKALKEG